MPCSRSARDRELAPGNTSAQIATTQMRTATAMSVLRMGGSLAQPSFDSIGMAREGLAGGRVGGVFVGDEESSFRNGWRGNCLARRPFHGEGSNIGVGANADDHCGCNLGGPGLPAAMFTNEVLIAQVHRDARAIAIPASEISGGGGGA